MTGINKFLPFATGGSANVVSDDAYAALAALATGYQSGVAQSQQLNKTWRQSSVMAAVLGQIIANSGVDAKDSDTVATLVANLLAAIYASPVLTGDPKAPTPLTADNDTSIATTAFVKAVVASYLTTAAAAATYAPLNSPSLTGNPLAPTPPTDDNDTSIATTAFVKSVVASYAPLSSFGSSIGGGSGYQKLPSGLIVQWGQGSTMTGVDSYQTLNFALAFPNACINVVCGTQNTNYTDDAFWICASYSNTQATFKHESNNTTPHYIQPSYVAFGY